VRPEPQSAAVIALVAAGVFAPALIAPMTAAAPAAASAKTGRAAPFGTCAAPAHLAKGQIVVAVVVDFGGVQAKVLVTCVTTRTGVTGAQVLQAQARLVGYPTPRYADSGLLCGIDGYPRTGCGTFSGGHYAYWAYWHGGTRWLYASDGPAEWTVSKGDVEGWRYEPDGTASPSDPPPRAASNAAVLEVSQTSRRSNTATTRPASVTSSGGDAAGPIHQPNSSSGGTIALFVGCVALITLIGAAAILRARRPSRRAT
jgi:hypothetical protein